VQKSGGDFEAGPLADGGFRLRVSLPLVEGSSREGDRSAERRSPVADGAQVAGEDGGA
jgi:hypothetical protein